MTTVAESIVAPVAPVAAETEAPGSTETHVEASPSADVLPENAPIVPETDDMSARFAALARKEKHIREQEDKYKSQEDKYKGYADLADTAKANPLAVMEKYGLSLDDLIAASLGEDKPEPTVEEQLQALRDEMAKSKDDAVSASEAKEKAEEEAYQKTIDEAIETHRNSIIEHLKDNSQYELIKLTGSEGLVWEVTEAHFDANQEVLTPEQASQKVEEYLEVQVRSAMKLDRFGNKPAEESELGIFKSELVPTDKVTKAPTLTQDLSATAPSKPSQDHLSMDESKASAAQLIKWT